MALLACTSSHAFPDGAPWGAANPQAEENCAGCHFDSDALHDSPALAVRGLPDTLSPDTVYALVVAFKNPGGIAAGFQMIAGTDATSAGTFSSETDNTETSGAAIRTTSPLQNRGPVEWPLQWRTPKTISSRITLYVAASAANFDQSALGDNIHFRSYEFAANSGH